MTNYALADAAGICAGAILLSALSLFPGYLLGHWLDLWQFRRRSYAFQLAAAVSLSISVCPIATFFFRLVLDWTAVWICYAVVCGWAVWVMARSRPRFDATVRRAFVIGSAWFLFAGAWLMDWQFSSRVYFPIYGFDYATRAAFVHSLAVFGLPAQSPLFNPGHPVLLHYHFVWLLQCALVHWLSPTIITARIAIISGAIWCGLGLMCAAALAVRLMLGGRSWIVIGLLCVTGLDIVLPLAGLPPNSLHLMAMLGTALGEPHYICALVGCVTGFLVLQEGNASPLVAALCFATAAGSGSFVALVFAGFLCGWTLFHLRESRRTIWAGVLSVILSLPYLQSLRGPARNVAGEPLLSWTVVAFSTATLSPWWNLATLPVNYFLELGFSVVCAAMIWRRTPAKQERLFLLMAASSLLICSFVKSGATPNNDLGWRGLLVAQFALLVPAAAFLERQRAWIVVKILIAVGLVGTGYDLFVNRFFPILADLHDGEKPQWMANDRRLGERTAANREAYAWLLKNSSAAATIAQNPDAAPVDIFSGLYGDRRIIAGDRTCTIGFGGTAEECAPVVRVLSAVFAGRSAMANACSALPAEFYTVKDTDPVWGERTSWNWTEQPVFANEFVRIFRCGQSNSSR